MLHAMNQNDLKDGALKAREQLERLRDDACEATRQASQALDGAWPATRVKAALLREPTLDGCNIVVNPLPSGVRLTGEVDSLDQVITAEALAAGTAGIRRVVNDLRVKPRS